MKTFLFILSGLLLALTAVAETAAKPFLWQCQSGRNGTIFTLTVAENTYVDPASVVFELKNINGKATAPAFNGKMPEKLTAGKWQWQLPETAVSGKVTFQGCSADGMCFMPEEFEFAASPAAAMPETAADAGNYRLIRKAEGYMNKGDFLNFLKGDADKGFFGDAGIIGILLLTLLGGLGLNLTPCILPMVPVTLIIIGAKGGGASGFRRGLAYGIGMALAYGILGLAAALLGIGFGTINSSPYFNFGIGIIFLVLALCMAGIFNFNFGARFRISPQKLPGSAWVVAFFMGALSALLAGACVAPVVISVLIFVAREYNSGNAWALLLPFLLGIGMALPWPLAGLGLKILPKPGKFMLTVKYLLAAVVAVMAVYYCHLGWKLWQTRQADTGKTVAADGFAALETAAVKAAQSRKPLLVKFGASWCKNCHAMDNSVFKDPEVLSFINDNFILVSFPAENPGEARIKALLNAWNIPGFPAFAIVAPR